MKNWNLLFRRTHLYLGMLLLPWMLIYSLSTFIFNHRGLFEDESGQPPKMIPLWERTCVVELPAGGGEALREMARRVMADHGISGPFGVQRQGTRLTINVQNFRQPLRLTYDAGQHQLRAEQREFAWPEVIVRLHQRTGYGQEGLLSKVWAFFVDLFCVTTLVWIGTGLYLWWKLPVTRGWGFAALGGGLLTILILLGTL